MRLLGFSEPTPPPWANDMIQPRITSLGRFTGLPPSARDWTTSTSPFVKVCTVRGWARSVASAVTARPSGKIGSAHVLTPVTNAQLVCPLLLETNTTTHY